MTVSAIAGTSNYGSRTSPAALGRRLVNIVGLIGSDLACFAIVDVFMNLLASPPGLAMFRGGTPGNTKTVIDLIAILAVLFVFARYLAGDYSRRQLFWEGARATTGALALCGTIYLVAVLFLAPGGFVTSLLLWLLLVAALPSARQCMRLILGRMGLWYQPTAIIGTNQTACEVYPVLSRQLALGLDVRWVIADSTYEPAIPFPLASLKPLFLKSEELIGALQSVGCRQVIFVPDDSLPLDQPLLIDQLVGADIGVSVVPSLRRIPLFGMSTSCLFGKDLLLLQVRNNLSRLPQRALKRAMDMLLACIALTLLSPLFLVVALLIKIEDGGPVFFIQSRVGHKGRDFRCWKFRTMAIDAEAQLARWAQENPQLFTSYRESNFKLKQDPRVTRIGAWLRRKSIDEFPQIFNVLLGEMSLVGPRPLLRRELPDYGPVISLYSRVRPGITGLWQISGRSHTTFAERVSYDEWYIKNWTVWYDVVIILKTAWVLLRGNGGAY